MVVNKTKEPCDDLVDLTATHEFGLLERKIWMKERKRQRNFNKLKRYVVADVARFDSESKTRRIGRYSDLCVLESS